jgi:hypothetical protein
VCTQCEGSGVNSADHFNGRFKAGALCWLCRYNRSSCLTRNSPLEMSLTNPPIICDSTACLTQLVVQNFYLAEESVKSYVGAATVLVSWVDF